MRAMNHEHRLPPQSAESFNRRNEISNPSRQHNFLSYRHVLLPVDRFERAVVEPSNRLDARLPELDRFVAVGDILSRAGPELLRWLVVPGDDIVHAVRWVVAVLLRVEYDGGVELASEAEGYGETGWAGTDYEGIVDFGRGGHGDLHARKNRMEHATVERVGFEVIKQPAVAY